MPVTLGAQPLLGPLVGLTSWTLFVEGWMYYYRVPAISKYKVDSNPRKIRQDIQEKIPPELEWPAQNYNHLMEQPTQFYATLLALNFLGVHDKLSVRAAWTYVALRVAHSLVQGTTNKIQLRFSIFATSSLVLLGLNTKLASIVYNTL